MPRTISPSALHLSALLVFVAACNDATTTTPPPTTAQLRVIHATPTLGAVTILVDGTPVLSGLNYGESSALVSTTSGSHDVVVQSGGQNLGGVQHTLTVAHVNTVFVADSAPQFGDSVVADTGQPVPTKANLRLVNIVGSNTSAPTQLQALIQAPNANPDSVVTSNVDATISSYWSLMYFDPGAFDVRYVAAGDTVTLAEVAFSVAAGEKKQIILQRAANGSYSASAILEP
jgi:Domain of unknown function (DUF4397)